MSLIYEIDFMRLMCMLVHPLLQLQLLVSDTKGPDSKVVVDLLIYWHDMNKNLTGRIRLLKLTAVLC